MSLICWANSAAYRFAIFIYTQKYIFPEKLLELNYCAFDVFMYFMQKIFIFVNLQNIYAVILLLR